MSPKRAKRLVKIYKRVSIVESIKNQEFLDRKHLEGIRCYANYLKSGWKNAEDTIWVLPKNVSGKHLWQSNGDLRIPSQEVDIETSHTIFPFDKRNFL